MFFSLPTYLYFLLVPHPSPLPFIMYHFLPKFFYIYVSSSSLAPLSSFSDLTHYVYQLSKGAQFCD
jgi:hypothetical protein